MWATSTRYLGFVAENLPYIPKFKLCNYQSDEPNLQWTRVGNQFKLNNQGDDWCLGVAGSAYSITSGKTLQLHPCGGWNNEPIVEAMEWNLARQEVCE